MILSNDLWSPWHRLDGTTANCQSLVLDSSQHRRQPLGRAFVLITTFVFLTFLTVAPVRAQEIPVPVKSSTAQSPPANPPLLRPVSTPRREARPRAETKLTHAPPAPTTAASNSTTSTPTPATTPTPQSGDDHLSFMAGNERDSHEQPPSASGLLLRTVGALLLIVGLIVAAAWGLKRFGGSRFGSPAANTPSLAVLNSLSLGDRRTLTIVRFGDRTLLLGSTAHSLTLLTEAEPEDFASQPRSVGDILNDDQPAAFAQELNNATAQLDDQLETSAGHHSPHD